jgi:hypothetical protein
LQRFALSLAEHTRYRSAHLYEQLPSPQVLFDRAVGLVLGEAGQPCLEPGPSRWTLAFWYFGGLESELAELLGQREEAVDNVREACTEHDDFSGLCRRVFRAARYIRSALWPAH